MNNLNSILIEGNLVRDSALKSTPKGTSVRNLTLANNRFFKSGDGWEKEVSFFDVETWGKLAEGIGQKAKKGRGVRVVGRLKQNKWVDDKGSNHSRIFVVAEHVEFKPEFSENKKQESQQTDVQGTSNDSDYEDYENYEDSDHVFADDACAVPF